MMQCPCIAMLCVSLLCLVHGDNGPLTDFLPYFEHNPLAQAGAMIISGNARFTVLTPHLIRMEYSQTATFEDRATTAVLHRALPVPLHNVTQDSANLIIQTEALSLHYVKGQLFSSTSIRVQRTDGGMQPWAYGMPDHGNLLGTVRSLDLLRNISLNCTEIAGTTEHDEGLHCAWGLVSRSGWALLQDHDSPILPATQWFSPRLRHSDSIDAYLFAHGTDYRRALRDYTAIGGRIPLLPRYAAGPWYTRWYDFDSSDVGGIVRTAESLSLPMDVFMFDMNWHQKYAWGGYSWDRRLFPDPADTLAYLRAKGLHMGANIHDADGVGPHEAQFRPMAMAMGLAPRSAKPIPLDLLNATYVRALEDVVLRAVERDGMDFWWIDWQQGRAGLPGGKLNPTIVTNHVRATDKLRRRQNERGLVLARWGGMGNHRYQVGFSGDVMGLTWAALAYQPYFSMTGTNVGFGFWSHDLVGPAHDHELHVRWLQFGAFSGVFRLHDRGLSAGNCNDQSGCPHLNLWDLPWPYFPAARAAVQERRALLPYVYTAMRQAYDAGLGIVRPLYYDWPDQRRAYAADSHGNFASYMFGDDLLVAPVVAPAPGDGTRLAPKTLWLPPGVWVERHSGAVLRAGPDGAVLTRRYDLAEVPVFVRGGAVVPSVPVGEGAAVLGAAARAYTDLVFTVYPGADSGEASVYEDDGRTMEYLQDQYQWITVRYVRSPNGLRITVDHRGAYQDMPRERRYVFRIVHGLPPDAVTVMDRPVPYARFGGAGTWTYDAPATALVISTAPLPTAGPVAVVVTHAPDSPALPFSGLKGALAHSATAKANLDEVRRTPESPSQGALQRAASAGAHLSFIAGASRAAFAAAVAAYPAMVRAALAEVRNITSSAAPAGEAGAAGTDAHKRGAGDGAAGGQKGRWVEERGGTADLRGHAEGTGGSGLQSAWSRRLAYSIALLETAAE